MGCDIHFFVEKKNKDKWINVSNYKWNLDRNYTLFGLLAGVRSRWAEPILPQRGLPSDISRGVEKQFKVWDSDAHSPSYYLLPELLEAQMTEIKMPVSLSISEYREYKKTNVLPEYHLYEPPFKATVISNQEMDRIINMVAFLDDSNYYTNLSISTTPHEISDQFWDTVVPAMKELSKDPNLIRCVFWFDN